MHILIPAQKLLLRSCVEFFEHFNLIKTLWNNMNKIFLHHIQGVYKLRLRFKNFNHI